MLSLVTRTLAAEMDSGVDFIAVDMPLANRRRFTGVSAKATGLRRSSAKARILLVLTPRERPIASSNSPFLSRSPSDGL